MRDSVIIRPDHSCAASGVIGSEKRKNPSKTNVTRITPIKHGRVVRRGNASIGNDPSLEHSFACCVPFQSLAEIHIDRVFSLSKGSFFFFRSVSSDVEPTVVAPSWQGLSREHPLFQVPQLETQNKKVRSCISLSAKFV